MVARDSMSYSESEIRRIAKRGFDIAMKRNKKIIHHFFGIGILRKKRASYSKKKQKKQ